MMREVIKIGKYRIVVCSCKETWNDIVIERIGVFVPKELAQQISRIQKYEGWFDWAEVEEPDYSPPYRYCKRCPDAPRDVQYVFRDKIVKVTEEIFRKEVTEVARKLKEAYNYIQPLPTYKQKQIIIKF